MVRRHRCPRPVNRLVMHRAKNLHGAFYQSTGSVCVKGVGNFLAPGMPGSGPQAAAGSVYDANTIQVRFSQCVNVTATTGIEYQINGGTWTEVAGATEVTGTQWNFDVTPFEILPGHEVRWRYVGGGDSIVDCRDSEDIGTQEIPVGNSLVLAGNHILLETGGTNVILLEDGLVDPDDSIRTEDYTP